VPRDARTDTYSSTRFDPVPCCRNRSRSPLLTTGRAGFALRVGLAARRGCKASSLAHACARRVAQVIGAGTRPAATALCCDSHAGDRLGQVGATLWLPGLCLVSLRLLRAAQLSSRVSPISRNSLVKVEQDSDGRILGARHHPASDRDVGQRRFDLRAAPSCGMPFTMEQDVTANPAEINLIGTDRVMLRSQSGLNLVEQAGGRIPLGSREDKEPLSPESRLKTRAGRRCPSAILAVVCGRPRGGVGLRIASGVGGPSNPRCSGPSHAGAVSCHE
jgi:hypothetical protein